MSAAPLDLRTPQMECPTCRATVGITKKGTVAQHTRKVYSRWGNGHGTERCPSSFTPAPDGAHAAWLRGVLSERERFAGSARADAADHRAKMEASEARAAGHDASAAEARAALAEIGATP